MTATALPPHLVVIRCPNGHDVPIPAKPGFEVIKGIGAEQRSIADLVQDCPVCGFFRHHADGRVEVHITPSSPRSLRPIDWCVTELLASLRRAVPSENERTAIAENGSLRTSLELLREKYEARGVDFDAVIDAVVAAEELVSR